METVWLFFWTVLDSWVEKVGIMLTLIPFIERIPQIRSWLTEKPLLDRFVPLLWVIGGACIFWGFYAAWLDQYQARKASKLDCNPLIFNFKLAIRFGEIGPDTWCLWLLVL